MKKLMLCLLALFLVTGCNEKEKEPIDEGSGNTQGTEETDKKEENTPEEKEEQIEEVSKIELEDVQKLFTKYYKLSDEKDCGNLIATVLDVFDIDHSKLTVSESGNVNSEFKKYIKSKKASGGDNKVVYSFKYDEFKNNVLSVMSEKLYNKNFSSKIFYKSSDGYLATTEGHACGGAYDISSISHINVIETKTGYRAVLFLTPSDEEIFATFQYNFTVVKQNGNFVIDSISKYSGALDSESQKIYNNFKAFYEYKANNSFEGKYHQSLIYENGKYYEIYSDDDDVFYKQEYTTKNVNGEVVISNFSKATKTNGDHIIGNHLPIY